MVCVIAAVKWIGNADWLHESIFVLINLFEAVYTFDGRSGVESTRLVRSSVCCERVVQFASSHEVSRSVFIKLSNLV